MENIQAVASATVFVAVIFVVATDSVHLTVAALLGALLLVFGHVLTLTEAIDYIGRGYPTLTLLFGVMVTVRAFEPTRVFDYLAGRMIQMAQGSGRRLLLAIVGITTPICAVLPNATTVALLAPLIPPLAADLGVDFVPLLILLVLVANSAGLLTLVGDPATYIVGDAINLTFLQYLERLAIGGGLAIAVIVVMLPWLFPRLWRQKLEHPEEIPLPTIEHPRMLIVGSAIAAFMFTLFVVGELLPSPVPPAAAALMGAALALFLAHHSKTDTVHRILADVDWSTLLFFMAIFVLIGSLEKTGVLSELSGLLALVLGQNVLIGSILLLFLMGGISTVIPNIPLVVAAVPLLKEYVVQVNLAPPEILATDYSGALPPAVLPLFYAMMFGATLGGNGTLVGASSNIVAAGIAEQHGHPISFKRFLRYGMPVMVAQLMISSLFIGVRFLR